MRRTLASALASLVAACGTRAILTGSPILGGPHLSEAELTAAEPPPAPDDTEPRVGEGAPLAGVELPPALDAPAAALHVDAQVLLDTEPTRGAGTVIISALPAPHRAHPAAQPQPHSAAEARALIGRRDPRDPLAFALDVAAGLRGVQAPAVTDGPALVAWASDRDAYAALPAASLEPGDLVVFDRALGGKPASLVAVVASADARGVTDVVYVARGAVRRGYLDPARPALARDRDGRVVNSYLRHGNDYPPAGTRYLAGELASARIRLP